MNYYTLAISLVLAVVVILIVIFFLKANKNRIWNVVAGLIIVFVVALISLCLADNANKDSIKHQKVCDAYCDCKITQNCSYTFNYNDVENCNCEVRQ